MRIKAKDGYNIIINDINIALQHGRGFYEVDDEVFNNSKDAKTLANYIEIDNNNTVEKKKIINTNIKKVNEAFIIDNSNNINTTTNAIVNDPNNEADKVRSVQNIKKDVIKKNETVKKEDNIVKPIENNDANSRPENNNELLKVEQVKIETDEKTNINNDINFIDNNDNKSKKKSKKK